MHIRRVPSFFLTKSTVAPQGDGIGQMYFLSSSSCSWIFSFVNSGMLMRFGPRDIGAAPTINSMVKSMSLLEEVPKFLQETHLENYVLQVYFLKKHIFSLNWHILPILDIFYIPFRCTFLIESWLPFFILKV